MNLSLATPDQLIFEGEITSLTAPGTLGYLQILNHHAPLITSLRSGTVTFTTPSQTLTYTITGGILEVSHNNALLLADSAFSEKI